LTNSEFRIGSMDGAFKLFEDMIHEEHRDRKTFICLNQQNIIFFLSKTT
jgi:hypothetical protein